MVNINIKEEEETLEIVITRLNRSKVKLILVSLSSLVSILLLTLFFISFSPILTATFFLIFFVSFRNLLWGIYGKETILITPSIIKQILDFGWFKDRNDISNENIELEIELQKLLKGPSEEILDSDIGKYQRNGIIRFKKNRNVLLEIDTLIPSSDLGKIESLIQARLK